MNSEDRAEAIATALIWLIGLALFAWSWQAGGSFQARLIFLAAAIAAGAVTFFGCCAVIRIPEMVTLVRILKRKLGRA